MYPFIDQSVSASQIVLYERCVPSLTKPLQFIGRFFRKVIGQTLWRWDPVNSSNLLAPVKVAEGQVARLTLKSSWNTGNTAADMGKIVLEEATL